MRKVLLTGVAMIALTGTAHAQGVPTYDNTNFLQWIIQLKHNVQTDATQALQYAQQIQQANMELQQLNGFIHNPNLGAAMNLLDREGLGSSLPLDPRTLASLASGGITLSNLTGKLQQFANLAHDNNAVYSPRDPSWNSQQLILNGNSIAGAQGAAQAAYADYQRHVPILQALRDRLATSRDPKEVADVQAALATETAWTNNLQGQMQAIEVNYQAQQDSRQQRDNESLDAGIDSFLDKANAAGRGL